MKTIKNLFFAALALTVFGACEDVPAPYVVPESGGNGSTEAGVYIDESFATGFGVFTPVETVGEYPWIIDYSTAKATSYVDGENKPAESWLIASPIDLSADTAAHVSFDYIIRYAESGKVAANHQLLVSTDYAGDPAAATWTNLPYNAVEGSDWNTFYKANVNVPADVMSSNTVTFALKYSATTKAGTWEVKNFKVASGVAVEEEEELPEGGEYTVTEAMAAYKNGQSIPAIVTGYIVGAVEGQVYSEGCKFTTSTTANTNILIADSPEETNPDNCMPVQLPSGAVRAALNIVDNPSNYKKQVKLTANIEKYFGVAGLKATSAYEIDGVTPEEPEQPRDAYISESFATSFGTFTTKETVGNYPWVIDYSTAKATSYVDGANNPAESWLISSAVDFTNATAVKVTFDYIIRYAESGKVADNHQLLISSDGENWTNIPYGAVEGKDWNTFYKAEVAVPAEFIGKSAVLFALKYSATSKAGTWEVKNFVVADGEVAGGTPDEPEHPGNGEYTVASALAAYVDGQQIPAVVTGYIVGAMNSTGYVPEFGTTEVKTNLLLSDDANESNIENCIIVQLPSGDIRNALNLADNPGNYQRMVKITGSIETYFQSAGLKGCTAYEFVGDATDEPDEPEQPEEPEQPAEPGAGTAFDFTNPTALTPSVTPGEVEEGATSGVGVEFNEITLTNNGYSITFTQGGSSTPVRFWTKTDKTVELRTYKGSTFTITAPEGKTMSNIKFQGYKVVAMTPDSGTLATGTWTGNASSVTFSVTGTLNINSITIE